jgi:hypothetical protein
MLFSQLGVHDVESFLSSIEAVFDKGAKHSVLFVGTVKESTDVTLAAETASSKLHGMVTGCHI